MATKDETFVAFTPEQAAQYAAHRGHSYPTPLYEAILDYHQGPRDVLLDVGTGPGKVIFDLLDIGNFKSAIGTDTSAGMISEARNGAEKAGLSSRATFLQGAGEGVDSTLSSAGLPKVDVITVAMAAHWMQMPQFYASAAKALRPGGTLAIWTCTSLYAHPSTPNVEAVQAALVELEHGVLLDYHSAGTWITRSEYRTLDLPWSIDPPVSEFGEKEFVRIDWDKDGVPSAPNLEDGSAGPFLKNEEVRLEDLAKGLGSASSVIKYREANPGKAGTEEDPVVMMVRKMKEKMGGRESLILRPSTHLLLMRRS